jgi:predicted nucleic acid-binding protein
MRRVVADTNVCISAVLFGGLPKTFLDLGLIGQIELLTSIDLLEELDRNSGASSVCPTTMRA